MKKRFVCEVYGYVNDVLKIVKKVYFNTFEEAWSFKLENYHCYCIKEVK